MRTVGDVERGDWAAMIVGPCKTAYDAWKMSRLPGDFGSYEYEPVRRDEK
jgi:hypothetical protein